MDIEGIYLVSGEEKQDTPEEFYERVRGAGVVVEDAVESTQRWYPEWVRPAPPTK